MRLRWLLPIALCAFVLGAVLASCGDDEEDTVQRACSTELPDSSGWEGGLFVNASKGGGGAAVDEFNEYLAEAEAPISTSPCDAGRVFLHLDELQRSQGVEFQVKTVPGDSPDAEVEVTMGNLGDDSILAERWNLTFEAAEDDRIQLAEALRTQSCQPGRGHAAFTPKPCI